MDALCETDPRLQRNLEYLRALRPMDDDFMRCLFKDNLPLAQLVLRILTGKPDLILTSCQTQKDMKRLAGARSICLDAYGTDSAGKKYDLEIQRADRGASPRRARYHSSVLDVENLDAGQEFDALPDTYTIFITEKDFYGLGRPVYPIERINLEAEMPFDDGEHILYVNGEYRGDSDIGRLMHDFACTDAGEMNFELLADRTRYLKENPKGVSEMCKVMESIREEGLREGMEKGIAKGMEKGMEKGIAKGMEKGMEKGIAKGMEKGMEKGIAKGMEKGMKAAALRMLQSGKYVLDEIAAISGLSLEDIRSLQAGLG